MKKLLIIIAITTALLPISSKGQTSAASFRTCEKLATNRTQRTLSEAALSAQQN
jgi:hypothetical protein